MKKVLMFLFSIFLFSTAYCWETREIVDEFRDGTGEVRILQFDDKGTSCLFVEKHKEDLIIGFATEYIGGKGKNGTSNIKIKIDNNDPVQGIGVVSKKGYIVIDFLTPKLLEQMKKGKIIKVIIEKSNDDTIFLMFELKGFSEVLKKVK